MEGEGGRGAGGKAGALHVPFDQQPIRPTPIPSPFLSLLPQLGFTYLRDNAAARLPYDIALTRPLAFAIVDEADSVLIDDCRTPMILSGRPLPTDGDRFLLAQRVVETGGEGGGAMREAACDAETGAVLPGEEGGEKREKEEREKG